MAGCALQPIPSDQPQLQQSKDDTAGAATTFSYGPRCLHSGGQLNKGGSATRMSPQLGQERDRDLEIPGRGYSFRRVINTRAQRDLRALGVHGLKVVPVRLPADDPAGAIDDIVATQGKGSA